MIEAGWIKEAKEAAYREAEYFLKELCRVADNLNVEQEWFTEEALKAVSKIRQKEKL